MPMLRVGRKPFVTGAQTSHVNDSLNALVTSRSHEILRAGTTDVSRSASHGY